MKFKVKQDGDRIKFWRWNYDYQDWEGPPTYSTKELFSKYLLDSLNTGLNIELVPYEEG